MKRTVFFMIILAVLASGCGKKDEKSTSLNYSDRNPIRMVFQDTHKIAVESDYDITYEIVGLNSFPVLRFKHIGVLEAMNVGSDKVKMTNGYDTKFVDVIVDLFTEPSYEFGCNGSRIRSLFGTPRIGTSGDYTYYQYIGKPENNYMLSPTCFQMVFWFENNGYIKSDLYLRSKNIDIPLKNYFRDNFDSLYTVNNGFYDSLVTHDTVPVTYYRSKTHPEVLCGTHKHGNKYDDIKVFYYEDTGEEIK